MGVGGWHWYDSGLVAIYRRSFVEGIFGVGRGGMVWNWWIEINYGGWAWIAEGSGRDGCLSVRIIKNNKAIKSYDYWYYYFVYWYDFHYHCQQSTCQLTFMSDNTWLILILSLTVNSVTSWLRWRLQSPWGLFGSIDGKRMKTVLMKRRSCKQ